MRITSLNRMIVAVGLAFAFMATTAYADPVRWELDATRGTDFIRGAFVYDADTNVFSEINIESSDGGGITYTILSPIRPSSANYLEFFEAIPLDLTEARFVSIARAAPLTNAGGLISNFEVITWICINSACANYGNNLAIVPGWADTLSLVGTPIVIDEDNDGILDTADLCPGTVIPESVPTTGALGTNRYALTAVDVLTFAGGKDGKGTYTTQDTGGCSCEQIVEAGLLGDGHLKNGCSAGEMRSWVDFVAAQ